MSDTNNWQVVLDYLKPKPVPYAPEAPSTQQQVFLRTNAIEALFGGAAGGGKANALRELIATPSGFVKMADIHPGDFVLGRDGKAHLVLAESEIMLIPGYRLTFDDGAEVVCNDEHLWLTFNANELSALTRRTPEFRSARQSRRPSRARGTQGEYKSLAVAERNTIHRPETKPAPEGTVRTTAEIVATLTTPRGRRNHAIAVAAPLDLPYADLSLDPYVLGAWLGDGFKNEGVICGQDAQVFEECDKSFDRVSTRTPNPSNPNFLLVTYEQLRLHLRSLGVLNNKHIPHEYLWASEAQRLALLQGLMDTDGTVAKGSGSAEFCNTNKSLADGVAHLARSLGMKATVREGRARLNGEDYGPKWTVKFVPNRIVFRLERKAAQQKIATRRTTQFRYIVSAERVEAEPMKCIRVSSPDHLYLVTENFIPTHNSSALLMAALQFVDVPGYNAMLFRRTLADLTLPGALMDRFRDWIAPHDDIRWNSNTMQATFPSGARISFGYLNNKDDYLRYKGSELQFIGMDEVSEIRELDYRYLFSRLRRPSSGPLSRVPLRMRSGSNPAPNWVRQRFIVEGREHGRIFVPSKLTDNPGIDAASYRKSLEELDPIERRRLEEGDWWVTSLGSMFQREDFVIIDALEVPSMVGKTARLVRFWDFAATEPSSSNIDPDWTVGTLMLFDEGLTYIIDVRRARVRPDKVEHLVAQTAYEDGPSVAIRFETEPGSAGKMVADQFARFVVPGYDVMGIRATGDKETRARPFASAVANGLVRVVRSSWLTEWIDEFSAFPEACAHDDQVDSAVGGYTYLTGLGLPQRRRATIIV
jgi:predicted phage terminase large subunit-like protein